jgi:drug/metabolite transporter (DMT)-like permease
MVSGEMLTDRSHDLRALRRRGTAREIGSKERRPQWNAPSSHAQLVLAFAAIYLIWGSTYLGIRYAVETIPPLLMMGTRHLVAGILVYGWARRHGQPSPQPRHWWCASLAGALLFLGGHGVLAWAEQTIASGLAALLCATLPLWTVLLVWIQRSEGNLGGKVWWGILLGFAGVMLLVGPAGFRSGESLNLLGACGAVFSALVWAVGTLYTRRARLPASTVLSAAMQMITGGALLLLGGAAMGEGARLHLPSVSLRSALALAYLIGFGSIVAFTAFTWLVAVSRPSLVSTYAYVNPVIAVLLGWALAGERVGIRIVIATLVIVASVMLVSRRQHNQIPSSRWRETAADCSELTL